MNTLSFSTWVKSRFCSWSGIEGSGKAWPPMPEERRSRACRCLDSWDASTTSCPTRPSAHWPSSPQVWQNRLLHMILQKRFEPSFYWSYWYLFISVFQTDKRWKSLSSESTYASLRLTVNTQQSADLQNINQEYITKQEKKINTHIHT